jgi:hypothetical protein
MKIAGTLMMWTTWGIGQIEKFVLKQAFFAFFRKLSQNLIFCEKLQENTIYMLFQAKLIENCKFFLSSQEVVTEIVFPLKFSLKLNFLRTFS